MEKMMSACGVICEDCPAFHAALKGEAFQNQVVEAWHRIYGLNEIPEHICCGGCLGSDEELFYTSRGCLARRCCLAKGFTSCADCNEKQCEKLEHAQAVWDEVPRLIESLTPTEFEIYARPYCDHRKRLVEAHNSLRR